MDKIKDVENVNNDKIDDDDKKSICPICMDRESNGVIYPCGHTICFDGECKNSINKCPICRGDINDIIKFYKN